MCLLASMSPCVHMIECVWETVCVVCVCARARVCVCVCVRAYVCVCAHASSMHAHGSTPTIVCALGFSLSFFKHSVYSCYFAGFVNQKWSKFLEMPTWRNCNMKFCITWVMQSRKRSFNRYSTHRPKIYWFKCYLLLTALQRVNVLVYGNVLWSNNLKCFSFTLQHEYIFQASS